MKAATQRKLIYIIISFAVAGLLIFGFTVYTYFRFSHIRLQGDIDKDFFGIFGEFIGGVVGTIFNIITAILVYLTYNAQQKEVIDTKRLLQQQIDLSIKPDLYFSNTSVYGFANAQEENDGDYATHFSNLKSLPADGLHYNVNVDLINVGVGVAKNIEFYWEFDLDEIQRYLDIHFENSPLTMNSVSKNFVEFKISGLKDSMHMGQEFYKVKGGLMSCYRLKKGHAKLRFLFPCHS